MTEPTRDASANDPVDDDRSDEDRAISDVGLPHGGDSSATAAGPDDAETRAALDEAFPAEDA